MSSPNSRLAAAALLALSAGACVGLVLSSTPAQSLLHTVTRVQPVTTVPSLQRPGYYQNYQAGASQAAASVQPSIPVASAYSNGSLLSVTSLMGGCAAALAVLAGLFHFRTTSTEAIAMLAASGKKSSPVKSSEARPLWYPTAEAPSWLDGSLPGDRGFDPLGLAKPTEFLQFDLDALDQNAPKNRAGGVIGRIVAEPDSVSTDALQPYSEVFGLQRFRECELIHGRWAMLAVLGCLVSEAVTGVAWQNAGLVEVTDGASYFGFNLPFSSTQVVWFEVLAMGAIEVFRNTELNPEKRCYPGGAFDPLGLASKDDSSTFRLKEAELKHGRLAMIAFLGFAAAALNTGLGASQSFGEWATTTFN